MQLPKKYSIACAIATAAAKRRGSTGGNGRIPLTEFRHSVTRVLAEAYLRSEGAFQVPSWEELMSLFALAKADGEKVYFDRATREVVVSQGAWAMTQLILSRDKEKPYYSIIVLMHSDSL